MLEKKFALSWSALKKWKDIPPNKWYKQYVTKELPRPQSNATFFGSYLHALMLKPEEVSTKFVVTDIEFPSDTIIKVLNTYYAALLENNKLASEEQNERPKPLVLTITLEHTDLLKSVCIAKDYFRTQPDRAVKEISKNSAYFEFIKSIDGKTVISSQEAHDAQILQQVLLSDPMSKGFFTPKNNCEVVFETHLFQEFDLSGFETMDFMPLHGYIDIIHFNHKRNEVREVDLKYTEDAFNFYQMVRLFDYPGQHSFYDNLIREWLNHYKDGQYKDYTIMNPLNVVIDNENRIPYIYEYSYADLHIKRYGFENSKFKGWEDHLNEIAWHFDNNDWSRPKSHIMNKKLLIDVFNRK